MKWRDAHYSAKKILKSTESRHILSGIWRDMALKSLALLVVRLQPLRHKIRADRRFLKPNCTLKYQFQTSR
jgi:hypothetical protein